MDEKDDSIIETSNLKHEYYTYVIKRTLQFIVPVSVFSYLFSYLSSSSVFVSYNIQFSTPVFSLFAQALDRKYMFLICNGILAFLVKNLRFSNYGGVVDKSAELSLQQVNELPSVFEAATVHDDVASMEYGSEEKERIAEEQEQEQDRDGEKGIDGFKTGVYVSKDVILEEEEADDNIEIEDNASVEDMIAVEVANDAHVSTEELNKKFEEFIRKMKEEIRIEAQQKIIAV